ncbi:hypothetical protein D3C71_1975760 [compost metagenome]
MGPIPWATSASAAAPCSQTAPATAWSTGSFCANNEPSMPANTSPVPAVAKPGLPLVLIRMSPAGLQTTVPAPLRTIQQW